MNSRTKTSCDKTTEAIKSGLTPTGDILLEINEPELTKARVLTPKIDITKKRKINCLLLLSSMFNFNIKLKLSQAKIATIHVGTKNQIFLSVGNAASNGIAGISCKLKISGEICVAEPSEKPEPKI